jgi:ribonucrease Y
VWVLPYLLGAAGLFAVALFLTRRTMLTDRLKAEASLRAELETLRSTGRAEAGAARATVEAESREQMLGERERAQEEASRIERELARREDELERRAAAISTDEQRIISRQAAAEERESGLREAEDKRRRLDDERKQIEAELLKTLERVAGERRDEARQRMIGEWVEQARAEAAELVRRVDAENADVDQGREAKRVMGIAVQRYQGHYLTERLLSNLPLLPDVVARVEPHLAVIEEVSNVRLQLADDKSAIRLEGQDSFGREIARRAISRFGKNGVKGGDPKKATEVIKEELEREVFDLGKRAFKELEIPRAHPDIVRLVGRLNWRTSYTQNQWKHAVEAAFLCGMMASELGLDVKIARRAALMHDIGKALTHAIDGSHAVIGADYARRLGEDELVANAIGAHHTEEPFNSTYALLVAASDAMSGARPGARREQTDNYVQRLDDLERIGGHFHGVERAYAVQGGRELRVYVKEDRVTDERAVALSTEIAHQISDELTFPGQIKVTVIREVRTIEVAG